MRSLGRELGHRFYNCVRGRMARFTVREIQCKSAINRVQGMPFGWSINPYRGCRHACVYCYARPTHEYLGMGTGEEFQEVIFAKVNAPEAVRRERWGRSWRGGSGGVGAGAQPAQAAGVRSGVPPGILRGVRGFKKTRSHST